MAFRRSLGRSPHPAPIVAAGLGSARGTSAGAVHLCDMALDVATSYDLDLMLLLAELALRLGVIRWTLSDVRSPGR